MTINDVFPSRFLKGADLQGGSATVTILRVAFEVMGRTRETKPVVYFQGKTKGLILNKTRWLALVDLTHQENSDAWVGALVQLAATPLVIDKQTKLTISITAPVRRPVAVRRDA